MPATEKPLQSMVTFAALTLKQVAPLMDDELFIVYSAPVTLRGVPHVTLPAPAGNRFPASSASINMNRLGLCRALNEFISFPPIANANGINISARHAAPAGALLVPAPFWLGALLAIRAAGLGQFPTGTGISLPFHARAQEICNQRRGHCRKRSEEQPAHALLRP